MDITIENNKVIVNLDPDEFAAFETMFANLQKIKTVKIAMKEFPQGDYFYSQEILPMHLCRTIGEANLSNDPFATVSLYPFWKHGFAFRTGGNLAINPQLEDPHKKGVAADEFGMGFTAWAMEEIFECVEWADTSALLKQGAVFPVGTKRPDFVCTFKDGSLGIFEAKGTKGTNINNAIIEGKVQTAGINAPVPIKYRVVVGAIVNGANTKVILLDPPGSSTPLGDRPNRSLSGAETSGHEPTNLTPDLVAKAAKAMRMGGASIRDFVSTHPPTKDRSLSRALARIETTPAETIFRSKDGKITLVNEQKPDKKHGWLDVK